MRKLSCLVLSFTFLACLSLVAGDPVYEYMQRDAAGNILPDQNFFDIQARFYARWGEQPGPKHSGWKQFKRWEYFWQGRINPDGSFPDVTALRYKAWAHQEREIRRIYGGDQLTAVAGEWTALGPEITNPIEAGQTWAGIGRVNVVSFHPNDPNQIWAASPTGGIWRSMDKGQSWEALTDDLPVLNFSDIAFDQQNPDVVYAASGDRSTHAWGFRTLHSLGLYKSTDAGKTWSLTGLEWTREQQAADGDYHMIYRVLVDPNNGSHLYVGTNRGIYRSANGGNSFEKVSDAEVWDMEFQPNRPRTIYAVGRAGNNAASMYISRDAGSEWEQVGRFEAQRFVPQGAVAVSAADPNMVYMAVATNGFDQATIYRSRNAGNAWETRGQFNTNGVWGFPLEVSQTNTEELWVGDVRIVYSSDGGLTFNNTGVIHADQHYLKISPHDGQLYAGCDGGVYRSADKAQRWTSLNRGLMITQFYRITSSTSDHDMIIAGTQDNGTMGFDSDCQKWDHKTGGDGMQPAIHPSNDSIVFTSWQNGGINISTDRAQSFSRASPDSLTGNGAWITPFAFNPQNPDEMFFGYRRMFRVTNLADDWEALTPNLHNNAVIVDLELCHDQPQVQYALTASQRLFRTTDYWESYAEIGSNIPRQSGGTLRIAADPHDPATIWVVLGGFRSGDKVFRSDDAGAAWQPMHDNLPQAPVESIIVQRDSDLGAVYVGTDVGVWYRDNTLQEWLPLNKGMPAVLVRDFSIDYNARKIRAASYGRGLWEMPLVEELETTPHSAFNMHLQSVEGCSQTYLLRDHAVPNSALRNLRVEPMDGVTIVPMNADEDLAHSVIQFTANGEFTVSLDIENSLGSDTHSQQITISGAGVLVPPVTANFEAWAECAQGCNVPCNLRDGWRNVSACENLDNNDWSVISGPSETERKGVGPAADNTLGTAAGRYLAINSNRCRDRTAILESPCVNLMRGTLPELTFFYFMNGADPNRMGSLRVDAIVNGELIEDIIEPITGNHGPQWVEESLFLGDYRAENVKIRFRAGSGSHNYSDIAIDDVSITFRPAAPLAEFNASTTEVCLGENMRLLNASVNTPDSYSWLITPDTWEFAPGSDASSENPAIIFREAGSYSVELRVSNNLGNDILTKADFINVIEVEKPNIERISGIEMRSSVEGDQYIWYKNGELTELNGRIVTVPNAFAVYELEVRRADCLSPKSEEYEFQISTSVAEAQSSKGRFRIDPNPHSSDFVLHADLNKAISIKLKLTDAVGRTVYEIDLPAGGLQLHQSFDMRAQPAGVYFMSVEVGGEVLMLKAVKQGD